MSCVREHVPVKAKGEVLFLSVVSRGILAME
jgi:hypothetical protein